MSQSPEAIAFSAGAALAHLHPVGAGLPGDVPPEVLRDRLALRAALACLRLEGRPSTEATLRDAVMLARPGDPTGPAGEVFTMWRMAARVDLTGRTWQARLDAVLPVTGVEVVPRADLTPGEQAVAVLRAALFDNPRGETAALIRAEACLARALGWPRLVPLIAPHLRRRDLLEEADAQARAVHGALLCGVAAAVPLARDLARRAKRLRSVAPRLRAKAAPAAVAAILSTDAVAPVPTLSPVIAGSGTAMTDRAARRLCERLVALGALRELTGRTAFRLYGL